MIRTAAILAIWASAAQAHDWYPLSCCSDQDCFPAELTATADGWRIESSGEVVPYDDPRIKQFPELAPAEAREKPHACHIGGDTTARAICVFPMDFGS